MPQGQLSEKDRMNMVRALLGTDDAVGGGMSNYMDQGMVGPQSDFEINRFNEEAARVNEENARLMQGMPNPNLGNPTSRQFADPEIDEALLRQRKERIFGY
jgi:hypothetical protein